MVGSVKSLVFRSLVSQTPVMITLSNRHTLLANMMQQGGVAAAFLLGFAQLARQGDLRSGRVCRGVPSYKTPFRVYHEFRMGLPRLIACRLCPRAIRMSPATGQLVR